MCTYLLRHCRSMSDGADGGGAISVNVGQLERDNARLVLHCHCPARRRDWSNNWSRAVTSRCSMSIRIAHRL